MQIIKPKAVKMTGTHSRWVVHSDNAVYVGVGLTLREAWKDWHTRRYYVWRHHPGSRPRH